MPNKLFLKPQGLSFSQDARFEWSLYDLTGNQIKVGTASTLESIDQTLMQNGIEQAEAVLLWPAHAVYGTTAKIPGNQARYIQQALPFIIEEQVAQDIDSLHLALGTKNRNGDYQVNCVDYEIFSTAVDLIENLLESASLKSAVVDADLLSLNDDDVVIYLPGDDTALIKSKDNELLRLNIDNLIPYLDIPTEGSDDEETVEEERQISVIVFDDAQYSMKIAELEQLPSTLVKVRGVGLDQMSTLSESYFIDTKSLIDLCQGDFKVVSASNNSWKKWRAVAVIAGLGFLLQLGVFIGKGMHYEQRAELASDQALSAYKKIVPGSNRITVEKLPRIIKGKLNQSKSAPSREVDFLSLLGETGHQFSQAKNKRNLAFKSITYNEQRGELVIEMQADNYDQLDELNKAIEASGLTAKLGSAVQEDKYFRGRISVSGS